MNSWRDYVVSALAYDAETGIFRWRERGDRSAQWNGHYAGTVAGSVIQTTGYITIRLGGKAHLAHRLAWLIVYGEDPPGCIDHASRVKDDNRICNLRLASLAENNRNTPMRKDNTSGVKGVCWHKQRSRWAAYICLNGHKRYLGLFNSKEEAGQAYRQAGEQAFGDFFSDGAAP